MPKRKVTCAGLGEDSSGTAFGKPALQTSAVRIRHALTRQNAVCVEGDNRGKPKKTEETSGNLTSSKPAKIGPNILADGSPHQESKEEVVNKPKPKRLALCRTITPPFLPTNQSEVIEELDVVEEHIFELPSPQSSNEDRNNTPSPTLSLNGHLLSPVLPHRSFHRSPLPMASSDSQDQQLSPLVLQSLQVFHKRRSTPHTNVLGEVRPESEVKGAGGHHGSPPHVSAEMMRPRSATADGLQVQQNLLTVQTSRKLPLSLKFR